MGAFATITQPKKPAGELLRGVRTAYGISQGELATRANTTQSAISRIESGKVSPSFDTLRELLRLLNADLILDASARDTGVDPTLNERNFEFSASDRVERGLGWADQILRIQRENNVRPGANGEDRAAWEAMDKRGSKPILETGPLLDALDRNEVEFVVIGGVAGLAHGSAYPTYDLDIAYARDPRNLGRMTAALRDIGVTLRGAPDDLPFQIDAKALEAGMNFTFLTDFGEFDILGHVDGIRSYDELRANSEVQEVGGLPVQVASLNHLIGMKRRADRPKDQMMVEEYVVMERLRREWDARHRGVGV
ncbi:MAG TPA: helix-turn-helix transcriptional regulator [Solirubrobacterales bacterium]|jgi:transcriptional regulator with XRE-family HTH domain